MIYDCVGGEYSNLTSIIIPSSVTDLGTLSFYYIDLQELSIGNGLTSFSSEVFEGTTALRDLSVGSSLTSFGSLLVSNSSITSIYIDPAN